MVLVPSSIYNVLNDPNTNALPIMLNVRKLNGMDVCSSDTISTRPDCIVASEMSENK